jgi:hypothetical protein
LFIIFIFLPALTLGVNCDSVNGPSPAPQQCYTYNQFCGSGRLDRRMKIKKSLLKQTIFG